MRLVKIEGVSINPDAVVRTETYRRFDETSVTVGTNITLLSVIGGISSTRSEVVWTKLSQDVVDSLLTGDAQ